MRTKEVVKDLVLGFGVEAPEDIVENDDVLTGVDCSCQCLESY